MFSGLTGVMCEFIAFLLGPWVWVIGVIAIGIGGLALALEEGRLAKIIGGALLGIGVVIAAPKVMDKFVPIGTSVCSSVIR
jgi:energy-converting hydrogenase Eha subunit C